MTIVCGTDFSPSAAGAVDASAALAAQRGAPMHLVHVVDGFWQEMSERAQTALLDEVRGRLHADADTLRGRGVTVLGSHAHSGLSAPFAGSVAQRLIARSGRPVLVVGLPSP